MTILFNLKNNQFFVSFIQEWHQPRFIRICCTNYKLIQSYTLIYWNYWCDFHVVIIIFRLMYWISHVILFKSKDSSCLYSNPSNFYYSPHFMIKVWSVYLCSVDALIFFWKKNERVHSLKSTNVYSIGYTDRLSKLYLNFKLKWFEMEYFKSKRI